MDRIEKLSEAVLARAGDEDSGATYRMIEQRYAIEHDGMLTPHKFGLLCDLVQEFNRVYGPTHDASLPQPPANARLDPHSYDDWHDRVVDAAHNLPAALAPSNFLPDPRSRMDPFHTITYLRSVIGKKALFERAVPDLFAEYARREMPTGLLPAVRRHADALLDAACAGAKPRQVVPPEDGQPGFAPLNGFMDATARAVVRTIVRPLVRHAMTAPEDVDRRRFAGHLSLYERCRSAFRGRLRERWRDVLGHGLADEAAFLAEPPGQALSEAEARAGSAAAEAAGGRPLMSSPTLTLVALRQALSAPAAVSEKQASLVALAAHAACAHATGLAAGVLAASAQNGTASDRDYGDIVASDAALMHLHYGEGAEADAKPQDFLNFFSAEEHRYLARIGYRRLLSTRWPFMRPEERRAARRSLRRQVTLLLACGDSVDSDACVARASPDKAEDTEALHRAQRQRLKLQADLKKYATVRDTYPSYTPLWQTVTLINKRLRELAE